MISHISIKDFALIENVEIDFHDGLNIITGETGAGKSIVIEAVSLALGSRADTSFVRTGKAKAVIQLVSSLDGEEVVTTREISSAGKNLCRINGEIVTLAQLASLCRRIADIHGQYDHQSLLNPENHINLLDSYNGKSVALLKGDVASDFSRYAETKKKLAAVVSNQEDSLRKREFMRYELDEISKAKPVPNEDSELAERIALLANSEKIYQNLSGAYAVSYGESPSALDGLKKSLNLLQEISGYSPKIAQAASEFQDAYYKLEDLCGEIRGIRDRTTFSQEDLDNAMARLDLLDSLKRKYGGTLEKVLWHADQLEEQLSGIENADGAKKQLAAALAEHEERLEVSSAKLSALRKESACELEQKILAELKELNFSDSSLAIDFSEENACTANGIDRVEFLISTNKGEPLKPLSKIASGGEMSRIMLAFKKIIADYDEIGSMVFDEIDSGISGIAASTVGKKLRQIAENHQVICITHLPQIAAYGSHHYMIQKGSDGSTTCTTVAELDAGERVMEVARLLGGINTTSKTMESARELLDLSK
ncbi:MAG: DNA repair protein RecN [Clostridiales bacterium]|nr:DNA repair protein RecN [Clostridiales bacterium]